jgi:hypothetical protein
MATYFRLLDVGRQFFDSNGDPLNGGKLYTYEAGTTTNKSTYQDDAGASAHANPIELDSAGRVPAEVWGTTGAYKLKLDNSLNSNIWTRDDIVGFNDTTETSASEWIASGLTPTYASATSFTFAGDQTTVYHAGRRLKVTDNSGTVYASIVSSAFGAVTTVTVDVDSGGGLTSPVTAVQYGVMSAVNTSHPIASPATLYAFYAVPSSNQGSVASGVSTKILYQTESYDYGANFSSSNFVVPATGVYRLTATVQTLTNLTDGKTAFAWFSVGGATAPLSGSRVSMGVADAVLINMTYEGPLTLGDSVSVYFRHDLGSDVTMDANGVYGDMSFAGSRVA